MLTNDILIYPPTHPSQTIENTASAQTQVRQYLWDTFWKTIYKNLHGMFFCRWGVGEEEVGVRDRTGNVSDSFMST